MIGLSARVSTTMAATVLLTLACGLIPIVGSTQSRADAVSDCMQASKDPDRGIRGCTAVIKRKPEAAAYYNRGNAYKLKGELDLAIADYTKAIALDPEDVSAHYNRAITYNDKGDYDRAIADYTKVIELYPEYAIAYTNRGIAYENKGEHVEALADYTWAIALNPKDVNGYYARALTCERIGQKEQAIADFRQVLSLDPNHKGSADGLRRLGASLRGPALEN